MPTTNKRSLKAFLCHAHSDAAAVYSLYNRLVKDGVDAWLDKENLLPGSDWEYEIRQAVRESDVVVVCHSKQFNQKGFRQKEVRIALEEADLLPKGEIFIIPARLEECDVLEDLQLAGARPPDLRRVLTAGLPLRFSFCVSRLLAQGLLTCAAY